MVKKVYTIAVIQKMIRAEIEEKHKGVMSDFARSISNDPSFISYISKFLSGKYKTPDKRLLDYFNLQPEPIMVYYAKD